MRFLNRLAFGLFALTASSVVAAVVVRDRVPSYGGETDDTFSVVAVLDGAVLESRASSLREGRAVAFMGGIELDLLDVTLEPGATLVLRAFMGGIDVVVPAHWRIELMSRAVMGGVENLTDPDGSDDGAPQLLVDALAILGGVEIHEEEVA